MNGYITAQEAAEKWNVTPRQVQILCKQGRIKGAEMMSRIWIIRMKNRILIPLTEQLSGNVHWLLQPARL